MADRRPSAPAEEDETDDVTALVGSRLCHDLINPLGAIGNGVELLSMSAGQAGPEVSLIEEAVRDAQSRIRFFRIAFGAAQPDQRIARREIAGLLDGLYGHGGRLRVDWPLEIDLPRREAKLALLCLACAEHALPLGGDIAIALDDGGIGLAGTAKRVQADPDLWDILAGDPPRRRTLPAEVQFLLLAQTADEDGRAISTQIGENSIEINL
ncbi:histidine phosphotransferase [Rhodobacterales bacterium HKCCE3408]|nr:histidine phosphotransferase [Rhodobacterales bacterium HKCCE3408]